VTRERAQIIRLLLMCAAWAVGRVLVFDVFTQAGVTTEDLGRPRLDRGNIRYWRGRPIDEDPPKRGRWN
jgi:hypothetical protein